MAGPAATEPCVIYAQLLKTLCLAVALREAGSLEFVAANALAIEFVTPFLAAVEFIRISLRPAGLTEAHFGWPPALTRPLHADLKWTQLVFSPPFFIACQFAAAGLDLASSEELRAHNNSLGRLLFILAMVLLAASLFTLFRPRRKVHFGEHPGWFARLSVFSYPVIICIGSSCGSRHHRAVLHRLHISLKDHTHTVACNCVDVHQHPALPLGSSFRPPARPDCC